MGWAQTGWVQLMFGPKWDGPKRAGPNRPATHLFIKSTDQQTGSEKKTRFRFAETYGSCKKFVCEHQQTFNIFCILVPIHLFHQPDKLS
jgi:hypothetical protein